MARDKDRAQNPATAHLKLQKKTALKKGKAQVAAQRTEKLARRNPERLQKQIDDLKATEAAQGGQLRPRDKQALEQLERDVKAIRKAREAGPSSASRGRDGEARGAGSIGRGGRGGFREDGERRGGESFARGKRRRDQDDEDGVQSEETDEDVRRIPMPRDTPPPLPSRPRRPRAGNPNDVPLGQNKRDVSHPDQPPTKPVVAQTTYSAAPQIRDLQKESTSKFVPAAVAARLKQRAAFSGGGGGLKMTGEQRLLEPEEVDALERDGYLDARMATEEVEKEAAHTFLASGGGTAAKDRGTDLDDEEAAFEREMQEAGAIESGDQSLSYADEADEANEERRRLAEEANKDAEEAATAMMEEDEHILKAKTLADELGPALDKETSVLLRYQQVEDIEDDDDEW